MEVVKFNVNGFRKGRCAATQQFATQSDVIEPDE